MTYISAPLNPLPERFRSRIRKLYGEDGIHWLNGLPALRATLLERWSLERSEPVDQLSYNYLEYAQSPKFGPVVLKIGFPCPELTTEVKALNLYRETGCAVKLLDWDQNHGALLLERILPGQNLTIQKDEIQASRIAAKAMLALRQPPPEGNDFPTMEKWCQGFTRYHDSIGQGEGPFPSALFETAWGLVKELLNSKEDQYLLHGDLHHSNLLSREDGSWVVIDPKGVIGEFTFEAGPYLFNPIPDLIQQHGLSSILSTRLDTLAEVINLDRQRLAAWSFCRAVLAAIWSLEEGESDLTYWVKITEALGHFV